MFTSGNFELGDREHPRTAVVDNDQIEAMIKNDPNHTTRDIANIPHTSYNFCKTYENTRTPESLHCLDASRFNGVKLIDHIST